MFGQPGGELVGAGTVDAQSHAALLGELDRVGQQVTQHLAQPLLVGEQVDGGVGGRRDLEVQAAGSGQRAERGFDVVEQVTQLERLGGDVHLAGLDLRQVQDVVDQLQQVGAGRVDDGRVLDLLGGQVPVRVLRQQLREDQQRVQRRTQFVAHVGQELRLVLRGERELLGAGLQLLAGLLDLGVLRLDVAVLPGQQRCLVLQVRVRALQLLRAGLQLLRTGLQLGGEPLRLGQQHVGTGIGHHRVHVDADDLHELVEEIVVHLQERCHGGQLDHTQRLVLDQDRYHDHLHRGQRAEAGGDREVVGRHLVDHDAPSRHRGLADQGLAQSVPASGADVPVGADHTQVRGRTGVIDQ